MGEPKPDAPRPGPQRQGSEAGKPAKAPEAGMDQAAEIERLKREVKEAKDQWLRALAECENTKKRLHREKEEFIRYASETVVRELLPIVDSLDQALVAVDKQSDPQSIIKGVHLIYRQLLGLLAKEGVARIPTIREPFDPHKHEAVAQVDASDGVKENTVTDEVQVGYTMHGKVIRPAMVKVAKSPPSQTSEVRRQKSEPGNQKSEVGGQGSESKEVDGSGAGD